MSYFVRVAQTGFPAAVFLGSLGYIFGTFAGNKFESLASNYPVTFGDSSFSLSFAWRLAMMMSAAGLSLMAVYHMFASTFVKPKTSKRNEQFVDTESMLLELLDQADAAEKVRQSSIGFIR